MGVPSKNHPFIIIYRWDSDFPFQTTRKTTFWSVSESSVPLNPMVLLIIIPMKNGYFIGNINPTFSDKPILDHFGVSEFLEPPRSTE